MKKPDGQVMNKCSKLSTMVTETEMIVELPRSRKGGGESAGSYTLYYIECRIKQEVRMTN